MRRREVVMQVGLRRVAALLIVACCTGLLRGHETDQFTSPPGRDFADVGGEFTPWVYLTLERAINRVNAQLRVRIKAGGPEHAPGDMAEMARTVFQEFPNAYDTIEGLEVKLHSQSLKEEYPGQVVAAKTAFGMIYQSAHFPLDPRRVFKIWFASTFKAYGVHCGADKIGHFIDMGHNYYQEYLKAQKTGADDAKARAFAVKLGTEHPIFSEAGVLGYVSAGAYSNADLVSNYVGMLFYINLTAPVKLKGVERPAMLDRDGPYWKLAPHVRPNSDFFAWFFSDHYDEALNPSNFTGSMRGGMKRGIHDRADNLLWRYRDVHGCRRPAQYFELLSRNLRTYYGEPYGHSGTSEELISLSDACFDPVTDSKSDKRNRTGHTALHWAVEMGDVAAVQRLLKRGATVDAPMRPTASFADSEEGNTALHLAARIGKKEMIDALLAAGAKVNTTNRSGVTPLHMASSAAAVSTLLSRGASVNAADSTGRTPLHWAAQDPASTALAPLLNAGANPRVADAQGRTPLHLAVRAGNDDAVARLLDRGADANAADRYAVRPLHEAAQQGSDASVRRLLAASADVNAADAFGYTALHLAARQGRPQVAAALIERSASINAADAYGYTPLHLSARHCSRTITDLLLDAGAAATAPARSGATPLHEAAAAGDRPTVARLLAAGGSPDAADQQGRTPRKIARAAGFAAVLDALDGKPESHSTLPRNHEPLNRGGTPTRTNTTSKYGREYIR